MNKFALKYKTNNAKTRGISNENLSTGLKPFKMRFFAR
jgi:hypothetical protein